MYQTAVCVTRRLQRRAARARLGAGCLMAIYGLSTAHGIREHFSYVNHN